MTTPTPITESVKAALIYVRNDYANAEQWYVCPQCCQPCDVFYQDTNTQPQ